MSSNAIGQSVILLDSSQSVRAITDLEQGDLCREEKTLLLEEIAVLEQTRDKMFERLALKDSALMIYMNIDTAYQELQEVYQQKETAHKTEIKNQKRKKNIFLTTTLAAVLYILLQAVR